MKGGRGGTNDRNVDGNRSSSSEITSHEHDTLKLERGFGGESVFAKGDICWHLPKYLAELYNSTGASRGGSSGLYS